MQPSHLSPRRPCPANVLLPSWLRLVLAGWIACPQRLPFPLLCRKLPQGTCTCTLPLLARVSSNQPCPAPHLPLPGPADEEFGNMGGYEHLALVGTTAVVALIGSRMIYVANCGDSRAVLCRSGGALPLTDDHKAAREDETVRGRGGAGGAGGGQRAHLAVGNRVPALGRERASSAGTSVPVGGGGCPPRAAHEGSKELAVPSGWLA